MATGQLNPFIEQIKSVLEPLEKISDFQADGLRSAAVLLPFVKIADEWHVLFIHRADKGEFHRGEVAFPGGGREIGDHTLVETAKRETWEELGISTERIHAIGFLPPIPTISRYWVTPIIGIIDWPTPILVNPEEVKHFFTIPYKWLADPENWQEHELDIPERGKVLTIDYRRYQEEHLWGISARITNLLIERINKRATA
ncbi:putative Nudix hydrolase NudL [bioreactor metagenome]|uniref:Putative Nudix hydrolase NudL n=1 Tax=bioreactor metagenome TaxID=1076179 RepID=A0A644XA04_9ZZZZ